MHTGDYRCIISSLSFWREYNFFPGNWKSCIAQGRVVNHTNKLKCESIRLAHAAMKPAASP